MDIHEVVANVQRRKEQEAVKNELELRAMQQKDAKFKELREELNREFTSQLAYLAQKGIRLFVNADGDKTLINRDDSSKTLTITFVPLFYRVAFNFDGGAAAKRALTVESETRSGLLRSREDFYLRREDQTVLPWKAIASFVSELLDMLLA